MQANPDAALPGRRIMQLSATDIEQALRGIPDLPVQVDSWLVETGTDWTDDAAVWVWGILPDPEIDTPTQFALRKAIRGVVRKHAGNDIGVYIRFRSTADLTQTA